MTGAVPYIALILVVIGLAIALPGWLRRASRNAGTHAERQHTASRLAELLDELGTTIVIHAPLSIAREIVDDVVLQQPRRFQMLDAGRYGIRFVEADDAVVHLGEDADGARLQVEQFREYLGMPKTSGFWQDLRSQVTSGAGERGVSITQGPTVRYSRGASSDADGATWRIDD